MNSAGIIGYSYVPLNQFNQSSYVKDIGEVMNKIAKSIIFVATDVDHNYPPNRTRYFVVNNNNNCCSKLLMLAGFYQQLLYDEINMRDLENIYNLQTHAKRLSTNLLKSFYEPGGTESCLDTLKDCLNELISHKAGDSLTMCMTLVLYLYQESKIGPIDKVEFVFLENMAAKGFFVNGKYHLDHCIVKINGWYFDPLTNTSYDEDESNRFTNQFESNDYKVKLRGLNDFYKLNEAVPFNKARYLDRTDLRIEFPDPSS